MIDEAEAIARAKAHLAALELADCDLHRASLGRHCAPGSEEAREEWTVSFIPRDEALRSMEPGEIWVIVDAQSGEARLMPLM